MKVAELIQALSEYPPDYGVLMAQRHFSRSVDQFGQSPLSYMCGHVDLGAEIDGVCVGQGVQPFVHLCMGLIVHALSGSPCDSCGRDCNAKPAPPDEEDV